MLRLRQAIPTGSALCNNLGRVIGLEGATALKFPWSVMIDSLFFRRMLGRATALESISISIGSAESLYFQRMLGRATVLKSLVCIDRVSVLSENVSIETVLSICGLSTPLFFLESRGGSFCGHFYTTQGMMCASGLQTVSEARSSVRVLLHKCYL